MSSSDLPVQAALLSNVEREDEAEYYSIEEELAERRAEEALLNNDGRNNPSPARAYFIRSLALLCACSLSVGSHYGTYILGPLKSRLSREMGTNNTEFSLMISAFSLNSTWTPLVGGLLASRLGTTFTSILATGIILLGQACLLIGNLSDSARVMALGMFVFGMGVSPLAVVQETIIVRFFKSHGLGVSLALGLVAGKGASFISALTSYPLSQRFGPHAPFYAATFLSAFSFAINIVYLSASKWLIRESGTELEASEIHAEAHARAASTPGISSEAEALQEVAKKRMVRLRDITKLGDVFWAYIGLNVLCGAIWSPFTHLVANILQRRFDLTEADASLKGSYVLGGSVVLYPITGVVIDRVKRSNFVMRLFLLSGVLTLGCYLWLSAPPSLTKTPMPGIISFALGHGFSPLLLVVIVPRIVPLKYVSTTLGAHKALEQTGSTIFQTLAGLALDVKSKKPTEKKLSPIDGDDRDIQYLLNAFVFFNVLEILAIIGLTHLDKKQRQAAARRMSALLPQANDDSDEEESPSQKGTGSGDDDWQAEPSTSDADARRRRGSLSHHIRHGSTATQQSIPLLGGGSRRSTVRGSRYLVEAAVAEDSSGAPVTVKLLRSKPEVRRGEVFAVLSTLAIAFAWVLFIGTAWYRLRSKEERGGGHGNYTLH
ncbi:MFS general substrate transporter [Lentinus tigrinus ALCF2SS1-7]|uniref:Lysosomal dipeptide transporter MFSD1 n=1 Tax=Lentinus tigrinus ALCF2SS1-6 TaxID=1328759 RepID=A0A5C2SN93_9APHY|nr:MFS general substrate transporter [Lentinus tigrinus ALCF2SS1-6]RPD82568.1 MFS general substrate transporter [Lentinus tigrinus ALCF2SS1-7]